MAAASALASELQGLQLQRSEPLVVVDSFLTARNAGDPWGAAGWCASLLELQDVDGQWFMDSASTSDWLRQLDDQYLLDTLVPPVVKGDVVTWTERLTRRSDRFPESLSTSVIIEVHTVIRDGKIAYLSAPYPPLAVRSPGMASEQSTGAAQSGVGTVSPGTMFVGAALGLAWSAGLAALGAHLLWATFQHKRRPGIVLRATTVGSKLANWRRS